MKRAASLGRVGGLLVVADGGAASVNVLEFGQILPRGTSPDLETLMPSSKASKCRLPHSFDHQAVICHLSRVSAMSSSTDEWDLAQGLSLIFLPLRPLRVALAHARVIVTEISVNRSLDGTSQERREDTAQIVRCRVILRWRVTAYTSAPVSVARGSACPLRLGLLVTPPLTLSTSSLRLPGRHQPIPSSTTARRL